MLDLHLVQQNVAILGDLDVAGAGNEHLHGPLGSEVGLEDVLDALGSGDVDAQGLGGPGDLGLGVENGDGGHGQELAAVSGEIGKWLFPVQGVSQLLTLVLEILLLEVSVPQFISRKFYLGTLGRAKLVLVTSYMIQMEKCLINRRGISLGL